jgi:hypothetical protein
MSGLRPMFAVHGRARHIRKLPFVDFDFASGRLRFGKAPAENDQ